MIFYGGTAPGSESDPRGIQFFAYDVGSRKVQYAGPNGPARYMIFAPSTGRVYFNPGEGDDLVRYDPQQATAPERIPSRAGIRAATAETANGFVYTVSQGQANASATLYAFNTKTEQAESLGSASVGREDYIASIDVDPTGRYLYYIPGAHGGADRDGAAVVQFDVKKRTRKVLAFLHPFYAVKYGVSLERNLQHSRRSRGRQTLRHVERQSRLESVGHLCTDSHSRSRIRAGALTRQGESQQPDVEARQPDVEARQPDGEAQQPDGEAQQPDGEAQQPCGEAQQPDEEVRQPE
jgi:hypothetical protein